MDGASGVAAFSDVAEPAEISEAHMELRDALVLERYRGAVVREQAMARAARAAVLVYAAFIVVVALAGGVAVAGRDPLDLDRTTMPDLLTMLGRIVVWLGLIAVVQVVACGIAQRNARRAQAVLDPDAPRRRSVWWLPEALYLVVIVASMIGVWNAFASLGEAASRAS